MNIRLAEILENNAYTDFGRRYNFTKITSEEEYRSTVPLSTYADYEKLFKLKTKIGEKQILSNDPTIAYALVSETANESELIPFTKDHADAYVRALSSYSNVGGSTLFLFESMPRTFKFADQAPMDSLMGIVLDGLKKYIADNSYNRMFKSGTCTSPMALMVTHEVMDSTYLRLLFALIDRKVQQIIAPFSWGVLEMFEYMETNWKELVNSIRTGIISNNETISKNTWEELSEDFQADPERADELERIFEQGFDTPILPRVWPNFKRIVAGGTGSFMLYTKHLKRYIGNVEYTNGYYATPEALIGKALPEGSEEYELLDTNSYIEFLPIGGNSTVTKEELVPGQRYELVITNNAGLYRYRIDEVIRCTSNDYKGVTFTEEYRQSQVHSFAGENLTEADVQSAVMALEKSLALSFADFCYKANETECYYTIYVEPFTYGKGTERLADISGELLNTLCESALMLNNTKYAKARLSNAINPCRVKILQPQTQFLYRDREKMRRQTAPDMFMPVRLLEGKEQESFFSFLTDECAT